MNPTPNVRAQQNGVPRIFPRDRRPASALVRPFRCRGKFLFVHLELMGGTPGAWTYILGVSRTLMEARENLGLLRVCGSEIARHDVEEFFETMGLDPVGKWQISR